MSGVLASLGIGFNVNKCKPALQMCITRLALKINQKTNQVKIRRRELGVLLSEDKEEKARIRVEAVIREDFTIEAYEILSLFCELLVERIRLVASQTECPPDLLEAVCTLIWASDRAEITELGVISKEFMKKYGSTFAQNARDNVGSVVNDRVVTKLAVTPPSALLVEAYLKEIAKEYNVAWEPAHSGLTLEQLANESSPAPTGFSVPTNAREREIAAMRAADEAEAAADRDDVVGDLGTGANSFGPQPPPRPGNHVGPSGMPPKSVVPQGPPCVPTVVLETKPEAPTAAAAPPEDDMPPPYASPKEDSRSDDEDEGGDAAGGAGEPMNYDSLAARFAALKR